MTKAATWTMDAIGAFDGQVDAKLMIEQLLPPIAAEFRDATAEARRLFDDPEALALRLAAMNVVGLTDIKRKLAFRRATDFAFATPIAWETYVTAHTAAVDARLAGLVDEVFAAVMAEKLRAAPSEGEA